MHPQTVTVRGRIALGGDTSAKSNRESDNHFPLTRCAIFSIGPCG